MTAAPLALIGHYEPWWIQILKAIVIFAVALQLVPIVLIVERKLLGRFQARYGPNRVGPYGALQPLADILKLLTKEQFRPTTSVGFLFALAPTVSILTAVAAFALIPFGDSQDIFGTRVGLYGVEVPIGPLYLVALGGSAVCRRPGLPPRRLRRGQPRALRFDRGRCRARGRLQHRVRRRPLRLL